MSYKYFVFDLETIPQNENLYTDFQKKQFEKKKLDMPNMNDITIKSIDPFLGKIIVIAMYFKNTYNDNVIERKKVLFGDNEENILVEFWDIVSVLDANTKIITFNGFNFDIPWIRIRSLANNIKIPSNCKLNFFNINPFKNTPHVDMMVELKGDKFNRINVGLGLACETFNIPSPKNIIDGSNVYNTYKEGKLSEIADYALRDVVSTGLLYEKMVELNYINGI